MARHSLLTALEAPASSTRLRAALAAGTRPDPDAELVHALDEATRVVLVAGAPEPPC